VFNKENIFIKISFSISATSGRATRITSMASAKLRAPENAFTIYLSLGIPATNPVFYDHCDHALENVSLDKLTYLRAVTNLKDILY